MVRPASGTAGPSGRRCSCCSSAGVTTAYWAEARGNPIHAARGLDLATTAGNPGGNMEGKEVRFGIANRALYATVTTDASCGAVNAMHDSFTPLGGLVPLVNIQLGEVVFGGVGAGLYGMLVMVVLTGVHRRADGLPQRRTWKPWTARTLPGLIQMLGYPARGSTASDRAGRLLPCG